MRIVKYSSFLLVLFNSLLCLARVNPIDSIQGLIAIEKDEKLKVDLLNKVALMLRRSNFVERADSFATISLRLSQRINYKKGEAESIYRLGWNKLVQLKFNEGISLTEKAVELQLSISDTAEASYYYDYVGNYLYRRSMTSEGLDFLLKGLKLIEKTNNRSSIANTYESLGTFYYDAMSNYTKAENYYLEAVKMFEAEKDEESMNNCRSYLGMAYWKQKRFMEAIDNIKLANISFNQFKKVQNEAYNLNVLGMIYTEMDSLDKAEVVLKEAIAMNEKYGFTSLYNLGWNKLNLGKLKVKQGKFKEGINLLNAVINSSKKGDFPEEIRQANESLAEAYEKTGDPSRALSAYKIFNMLQDSLYDKEKAKRAIDLQLSYDNEKKDLIRKHEEELKEERYEADVKQQKMINISVSVGLFLTLLTCLFIFRSYSLKKRANLELAEKNEIISEQKRDVEEKQKEILDSIRYAKRIQSAQIPNENMVFKLIQKTRGK